MPDNLGRDSATWGNYESTVASAATTDIGAADFIRVLISGVATITSFGTVANRIRFIRFGGILTLTYNATSLKTPGAGDIITAVGDTAIAFSDASGNWTVSQYVRANGGAQGAFAAGLFSALGTLSVPSNVDVITTSGYSVKGVGSGQYITTATTGATAYRKQSLDGRWWVLSEPFPFADHYGALGDGSNDDRAAMLAQLAHVNRVQCRPGGVYRISDTIDLRGVYGTTITGVGHGADPGHPGGNTPGNASAIQANFNNKPILQLYGPCHVKGLYIEYVSQQTKASHAASIAIELDGVSPGAAFNDVAIWKAAICVGVAQRAELPHGTPTTNGSFSFTLQNCLFESASITFVDLRTYGAGGCTNIALQNCYFNGGMGLSFVGGVTCDYVLRGRACGGITIDNCSIDGCTVAESMFDFEDCFVDIGAVRCEAMQFTKSIVAVVSFIGNQCNFTCGTFEFANVRIRTADGVNGGAGSVIFYCSCNDYMFEIHNVVFNNTCDITVSSANLKLLLVGGNSTGLACARIHHIANYTPGLTGNGIVIDDWSTFIPDTDPVEYFNGAKVFERLKSRLTLVRPIIANYTEGWFAPGGGGYSTTKVWPAGSRIKVIDATLGRPNEYYTVSGGANPTWEVVNLRGAAATTIGRILANSSAIANTETSIVSVSLGGASRIKVGEMFKISAFGVMTNTTTATTSTWRIRIGTTTLTGAIVASSAWVNAVVARTNVPFKLEAYVRIHAVGASGSAIGQIVIDGGSLDVTPPTAGVTAVVTIDTTTALNIELTFISGGASTTATFHGAYIEKVAAA